MIYRFLLMLTLALYFAVQAPLLTLMARAETIEAPEIMRRDKWLARTQPFRTENMQQHEKALSGIVVHHTEGYFRRWASYTTEQKLQSYHEDHRERVQGKQRPELKGKKWGGFAYHYFIDVDGKIAEGRDTRFLGDSSTTYDMSGLILVVLEGNFEGTKIGTREEEKTKAIINRRRLAEYKGEYVGEPEDVPGNKDRVKIRALPNHPTAKQKESLDKLVAWLAKTHKIAPSAIKPHGELAETDCPGKTLKPYLPTLRAHTATALAQDKGR